MIRLLASAAALIVPLPSGVASFPAEPAHAAPVPAPRAFSLEGVAEQGGILMGEADARTTALSLDGKPVDLAPDGVFLIGFDRDAPASALLIEEGEGWRAEHPIVVAPRAWRIERVDAPYRAGRTDAEFASLRPAEVAQIAAARRIHTDAGGWRQAFRWPATGRQSGWFGSQRVYQGKPGSYHSGADVAVPTGTPIVAPADGVVILAADRPFTLEGNLLMLDQVPDCRARSSTCRGSTSAPATTSAPASRSRSAARPAARPGRTSTGDCNGAAPSSTRCCSPGRCQRTSGGAGCELPIVPRTTHGNFPKPRS